MFRKIAVTLGIMRARDLLNPRTLHRANWLTGRTRFVGRYKRNNHLIRRVCVSPATRICHLFDDSEPRDRRTVQRYAPFCMWDEVAAGPRVGDAFLERGHKNGTRRRRRQCLIRHRTRRQVASKCVIHDSADKFRARNLRLLTRTNANDTRRV